jgi:hypothetical protein
VDGSNDDDGWLAADCYDGGRERCLAGRVLAGSMKKTAVQTVAR